jgi:hypothetical protein
MIRTVEMDFEFQQVIAGPPATPAQLFKQAASSDDVTIEAWKDIWVDHTSANHKSHGPFKDKGIGKYFGHFKHRPVIIVGSGPSLKNNVDDLKDTKGIPIISCLHNYQFLEDRGIKPDFYVTLDAGLVTVEEVSEGGKKTPDEYFESTKDKKLIAFIGTHPELIKKWKGEIIWFNAPIPSKEIVAKIDAIEPFNTHVSSGGNVLGACFYIAKAIMAATPVIFVGADFSFSYNNKFHGWDSKYDKTIGYCIPATDVYGNRVKTWSSYYNFKCWFESRFCSVPGFYINATEGGILGSYPDGNIRQIEQKRLCDVIRMYSISEEIRDQCENPSIDEKKILF